MSRGSTRNVTLTRDLNAFVDRAVTSGKYQDGSEVVREGLRLLMAVDRAREAGLAEFREFIEEGARQLDAGQFVTRAESRRRIKSKLNQLRKSRKSA